MPTVLKYGSLVFLEPSGPVQACNGIALPFYFTYHFATFVLGSTQFPPHFKVPSLHLTSLHVSLCNSCSWKYSISSVLQTPFNSLHSHFTSLITFQTLFLEIFDSLRTLKSLHFASLHFTSLNTTDGLSQCYVLC